MSRIWVCWGQVLSVPCLGEGMVLTPAITLPWSSDPLRVPNPKTVSYTIQSPTSVPLQSLLYTGGSPLKIWVGWCSTPTGNLLSLYQRWALMTPVWLHLHAHSIPALCPLHPGTLTRCLPLFGWLFLVLDRWGHPSLHSGLCLNSPLSDLLQVHMTADFKSHTHLRVVCLPS